jgi:DNA-binding beta-propeller fold protein YncE
MSLKPRFVMLCCLSLLLCACAQVPTEMRYRPYAGSEGQDRLWPGLPEIPRYRYAGQLTGEQNFVPVSDSHPAFGEKLLRWVVGLADGQRRQPRVLIRPQSGMVDASGRVLVTDVGRQAVFVFDVPQTRLLLWHRADAGATFSDPIGITAGDRGEILVSDATLRRIVRLDAQGVPLGSFGGDVLKRPTGLVRDPASGWIFCVDTGEHDIKVFDDSGLLVDRIGLRGKAPGEFNAPTHIALAGDRLYVTDTLNARVQILTLAGDPVDQIGKRGLYVGNLTRPKGVAVDEDGNVYVVESYYDHLLIFDRDARFLLPIGGSGSAIGQFYLPAGAWTDTQGRIYVADMYNGRVVLFQYLGS